MPSVFESVVRAPTQKLQTWLRKWEFQIALALLHGQYRIAPEGLILFEDKRLYGQYFHRIAASPWRTPEAEFTVDHNLVVDQAIAQALATLFPYTGAPPAIASWYLTMHSGSVAPTPALTAASYAATMNEITSTTEGFTNVTRPAFAANAPTAGVVNNTGGYAAFNCVSASSISVTGGALLSNATRGSTSGVLWSAAQFDAARTVYNGETFQLGYQTSLSD